MITKNKQDCTTLNYIEQVLSSILSSTITRRFSTSDFALLLGVPIGIMRLKICAIAARIIKYY